MKIEKVMIAGGGTLGSQVAWQCATQGFEVVLYDAFESGLETAKKFHFNYGQIFLKREGFDAEKIKAATEKITYTTSLQDARSCDLISESIPENMEIKKEFYCTLSEYINESTIVTTNSSTFLPRDFVEDIAHPERFLALHFANIIWDFNIGEIMAHKSTDETVIQQVKSFASEMGMVPVILNREVNGYILNTILAPMISNGMALLVNGVASVEDIDKTMLVSGFSSGPFQMLDVIGLQTAYNVETYWGNRLQDKQKLKNAAYLKEHYLEKGKLGMKTGEGFYKYPNPSFKEPDFLK